MKLAKREKYLIAAAVALVSCALLLEFAVFPFFDARANLKRGITTREAAIRDLARMRGEYLDLKKDSGGIEQALAARPENFTLFSFLEEQAGEAQVKELIKYMKPSTSTGKGPFTESLVEMKLESISLSELVAYLRRIEAPEKLVLIKRIAIQEGKQDEGNLEAVLQVLTLK